MLTNASKLICHAQWMNLEVGDEGSYFQNVLERLEFTTSRNSPNAYLKLQLQDSVFAFTWKFHTR